jgi:hypothetical protein
MATCQPELLLLAIERCSTTLRCWGPGSEGRKETRVTAARSDNTRNWGKRVKMTANGASNEWTCELE